MLFSASSDDLGWYVVNDNVMGGRSQGDFVTGGDVVHFTGSTNTNGGGFSSIRSKTLDLDLSDFDGITLKVKGDGRRYTWRLTTNARWRGLEVGFWQEFDTLEDEWQTVKLPFADFIPRIRGSQLRGPGVDAAEITGMGLMIYDGRDGEFELSLQSVGTYSD